jgi:hypothetical protein
MSHNHDVKIMMKRAMRIAAVALATLISAVPVSQAQIFAPGPATSVVPLPPPPPPPRIEVPVVPKLDAPPPNVAATQRSRGSFGDRVTTCLQDAAAAGLNSSDRAAYSRACANQ